MPAKNFLPLRLKPASCASARPCPEFALPGRAHRGARLLGRPAGSGAAGGQVLCGRWCPYCVTDSNAGARCTTNCARWARSCWPSRRRRSARTTSRYSSISLPFPILSNAGAALAEKIRHCLQRARRAAPLLRGDSGQHSLRRLRAAPMRMRAKGAGGFRCPRSSWWADGTIAFSEGYADFRVRPEPSEAMERWRLSFLHPTHRDKAAMNGAPRFYRWATRPPADSSDLFFTMAEIVLMDFSKGGLRLLMADDPRGKPPPSMVARALRSSHWRRRKTPYSSSCSHIWSFSCNAHKQRRRDCGAVLRQYGLPL